MFPLNGPRALYTPATCLVNAWNTSGDDLTYVKFTADENATPSWLTKTRVAVRKSVTLGPNVVFRGGIVCCGAGHWMRSYPSQTPLDRKTRAGMNGTHEQLVKRDASEKLVPSSASPNALRTRGASYGSHDSPNIAMRSASVTFSAVRLTTGIEQFPRQEKFPRNSTWFSSSASKTQSAWQSP